MYYECTEIRYKFFNGKDVYFVDYVPGIQHWYVYEGDESRLAAFHRKAKAKEKINYDSAKFVLEEHLLNS